ncbi:MAG: hypothetical protein AAF713_07885 [Pseudomonadota bacterium]
MAEKTTPVIDIADPPSLPFGPVGDSDVFGAATAPLSAASYAKAVSFDVTILASGAGSSPSHNHHASDEFFVVFDGANGQRVGAGGHPIGNRSVGRLESAVDCWDGVRR